MLTWIIWTIFFFFFLIIIFIIIYEAQYPHMLKTLYNKYIAIYDMLKLIKKINFQIKKCRNVK